MLLFIVACATASSVASAVDAPPPVVTAARRYLGRPYQFGARGRELDCMGLVFLAWADANDADWRKLSVNPSEIVAKRQLGAPVPGLDGVPTPRIDWKLLRPGDVIFLLGPPPNPAEPSLVTIDGVPEWVWHMGLYSGGDDHRFVVGDHFHGEVVEVALPAYLHSYAAWYDAIFVTRPGG